MLGTVAGEGVGVRDNRSGAVTYVFVSAWLAAARAFTTSGLQRQWRQRQQGRRQRLVYIGDGGREGVGGV